jgi:hypothetical protein
VMTSLKLGVRFNSTIPNWDWYTRCVTTKN